MTGKNKNVSGKKEYCNVTGDRRGFVSEWSGFDAAAPCKVCAKKRLDDSLLEQGPQEKEVGDETKCMVDPPASRLGRILAVLQLSLTKVRRRVWSLNLVGDCERELERERESAIERARECERERERKRESAIERARETLGAKIFIYVVLYVC